MQDMAARKAKVQDITALVHLRAAEGWKTVKKQMCGASHLSDVLRTALAAR